MTGSRPSSRRSGRRPARVLRALAGLDLEGLPKERREDIRRVRQYLEKRATLIDYPAFLAEGLPIGSGIVESANKLVVEARLKGAGMHWERSHANELLALRSVICSGRWEGQWPDIRRRLRRPHRRCTVASPPTAAVPVALDAPAPPSHPPSAGPRRPTFLNGKPTDAHPWKAGLAHRNAKT